MSGIGGGLHDDDRPPAVVMTEREIHAKWREWAFWIVMAIGLWASFQGQPMTAFWFCVVLGVGVSIKVIARPLYEEVRKTWNG